MKDMHLINKFIRIQNEVIEGLRNLEKSGSFDADLEPQINAAIKWADAAGQKPDTSPTSGTVPNLDPIRNLANSLYTYEDAFDGKLRSKSVEYRELLQELENGN